MGAALVKLKESVVLRVIIHFYIIGVVGFLFASVRPVFEFLIPFTILLNLFLLLFFHRPFDKKHTLFFIMVFVLTIGIEAVGVRSGLLFGSYSYGESSLGYKIFETPVLIGANWLILIYGSIAIVRYLSKQRGFSFLSKWVPFTSALFMVIFDYVMEPVAVYTAMWGWHNDIIPLQNYFTWFVISVLISAGFELLNIKTIKPVAIRLFLAQFFFFLILNLFMVN
ncbi:carotenoid biosynthesis protein [Marinilabiliaceae bacterium ANBcel2]|nr:carotenoid biosynthesis protein [Marinilabiliaceae bacterium ANBcel2]